MKINGTRIYLGIYENIREAISIREKACEMKREGITDIKEYKNLINKTWALKFG